MKDGRLTVSSVNSNTKVGYAIARYDGFSTVVILSAAGESTGELRECELPGEVHDQCAGSYRARDQNGAEQKHHLKS